MQYPIKYIENNLVWNHDGECFAYYELVPYNYSFLSVEQKQAVHDAFRQLIAQNRDGKIHALQISTESGIRAAQERSKAHASGKLREDALRRIDGQTDALVSMIGENQVDYRFYIGFKLLLNELDSAGLGRQAANLFSGFLRDVNHTLMGDFASMPNDEILRYQKMEKLLERKISRRFKVRRLDQNDFGYLLEHLYGRSGTAYEDYEFHLPKKKIKGETLVKRYDLIKPTRCLMEEHGRYLHISHDDSEVYSAYFTISDVVGELDFPSSEIFYYQQQQFTFPVDTSMNVEIITNKKALSTVRNKKKELKDLDNHAWESGDETGTSVAEALDSVNELETELGQSKEAMYKLSYVVRVTAPDAEELKRRCNAVRDFYDDMNVKLVRPVGDMIGLHHEFIPDGLTFYGNVTVDGYSAAYQYDNASDTLTVSLDSIAPGQTKTVCFDVLVNSDAYGMTIKNTAVVSGSNTPDGEATDDGATIEDGMPDGHAGAKSANKTIAHVGDTITYTITLKNGALATADWTDVTVLDVIPEGVTFAGNVQKDGQATTEYAYDTALRTLKLTPYAIAPDTQAVYTFDGKRQIEIQKSTRVEICLHPCVLFQVCTFLRLSG